MARVLCLFIAFCLLASATLAQDRLDPADVPPDVRARAAELERLYLEETPRWGERIRAGQGSWHSADLITRAMHARDPALINQALDLASKAGDRYGEGLVLAYQALYTPLVVEERATKWEQCLPLFDGIANPLLCAHVRLMVGGIRLEDNNFVLSLDHFQKALPVLEANGSKELEAEACLGLGNSLVKVGRSTEAVPYLSRAVAGYQVLGIQPRVARAEFVLGGTLVGLNRFDEASELLSSCRARFESLGEIPSMLASELYLGSIRERQGLTVEALAINQEVNSRAEKANAAWPLRESTLNIARLCANQGRYEQAEVWYRKALERFLDAGDLLQAANTRHTLATTYLNQGRDSDAEALILESLKLCEEAQLPYDTRDLHMGLTKLYWRQGRFDEAAKSFEAVLAPGLPLTTPPETISRPLRLWRAGRREEAITAYRELLRRVTFPRGDSTLAELKYSLVWAMAEQGQYPEAIQYFLEVLRTDTQGTYLEPFAWMSLGRLYLDSKQPEKALEVLQHADPLVLQMGSRIATVRLHQDLARAYRATGDRATAATHLEQSLRIYGQLQKEALYSGGLSSAIGMSRSFAWVCGQLAEERLAREDLEGAFLVTESGRDRLLAVSQIRRQRFDSAKARALRTQLAEAVRALSLARDSASSAPENLEKRQEVCERLEVDLLRETRSFEVGEPNLDAIRQGLTESEALLSLVWVEKSLHGFLVRRDSIVHQALDWNDQSTAAILAALSTGSSAEESLTQLSKAYTKLILPFGEALTGVGSLAIVPDGSLQALPFETMVDAEGHYLVESFDITYLTSARNLTGAVLEKKLPPLVVGDPDFGKAQANNSWPALPGSRTEAEAVGQLLGVKPLLGAAATKASFQQLAGGAGILHIASHAFAGTAARPSLPFSSRAGDGALGGENARDPYLDSGLVFAGANGQDGRQQGVLTGYEVLEMDLSNVQLAVLSACETGRGKATSGEGVLGLRRAFQAAGVHNLVTSLWAVDDAATSSFMTSFYQGLKGGASPLQALADCKRRQIKENVPPSAWGAFVLIGPLHEAEPTATGRTEL